MHEREADAETRRMRRDLNEQIENPREVLGIDAFAVVGERDSHVSIGLAHGDREVPGVRRVANAVGEQVAEHLPEANRVRGQHHGLIGNVDLQRLLLRFELRAMLGYRVV